MAEAVVDGALISRFFCHECSCEIEHLLPGYKCPLCSGGFIEELENAGNGSESSMDVSNEDLNYIDIDGSHFNQLLSPEEMLEASFRLPGTSNPQLEASGRGCTRRTQPRRNRDVESRYASPVELHRHMRLLNNRSTRGRQAPAQTMENLIQEFILNLSGVGLGLPLQQGGQPPLFNVGLFLGNPGDYVWGRDGLDAIVTQLLNQMDGTGPPPLPKKQIEEIPTIAVTQLQIDSKLQCSVCWEDFQLSEPVRQLPCQHFYHAPCIVPWLELHGTCPICRQSLGDQNSAEANEDTVGPSLAALFRAVNEPNSIENRDQNTTEVNRETVGSNLASIVSAASNSRTSSTSSTPAGSSSTGSSRTNSSNEI